MNIMSAEAMHPCGILTASNGKTIEVPPYTRKRYSIRHTNERDLSWELAFVCMVIAGKTDLKPVRLRVEKLQGLGFRG